MIENKRDVLTGVYELNQRRPARRTRDKVEGQTHFAQGPHPAHDLRRGRKPAGPTSNPCRVPTTGTVLAIRRLDVPSHVRVSHRHPWNGPMDDRGLTSRHKTHLDSSSPSAPPDAASIQIAPTTPRPAVAAR